LLKSHAGGSFYERTCQGGPGKKKEMLLSGIKPYSIALLLKIPRSIPDRIFLGKDVPYYHKKPIRDKSNWCSCCGLEPKMDGNRFLGPKCFHGNSNEEAYRVAI